MRQHSGESKLNQRLVLLGLLVLGAALAYFTGLYELVSDQERLLSFLRESDIWGPLFFVVVFTVFEAFGVPGIIFVVSASIIWPPLTAIALSMTGGVGASVLGFGFARTIGREWVQEHLPESFHRYDERLARHGFTTVVVVRLIFFLAPYAHWALGLSRVRFGPYLAGTVIGLLPAMVLLTLAGSTAYDWLAEQPREVWIGFGLLLLAGIMVRVWLRRREA